MKNYYNRISFQAKETIVFDGLSLGNVFFVNDIFDPYEEYNDEDRIKRLKFHVKNDDYFGHLATIFNLMTQDKEIFTNEILNQYTRDLRYMQKNYLIIDKEGKILKLKNKSN